MVRTSDGSRVEHAVEMFRLRLAPFEAFVEGCHERVRIEVWRRLAHKTEPRLSRAQSGERKKYFQTHD